MDDLVASSFGDRREMKMQGKLYFCEGRGKTVSSGLDTLNLRYQRKQSGWRDGSYRH